MDNLLRSIRTKEIVEKYKFKFNKDLGQNFLIDDDALSDIIKAADLTKEDSVLEVGPGIGTLTLELAQHAGRVLTIEIDRNLIQILEDVFREYDNIKLYHGDALKVDLKEAAGDYLKEPVTICANLPYYITTPLIAKFFKEGLKIKNIVLMVQKEVAERMAAEPNGKEYGALSLLVQYYSKPSIVSIVPPHCFIPRPKVDSVVVKLEVYETPPVDLNSVSLFFSVVRDSFNQRRKTLSNSLKGAGLSREDLSLAFENANIDPQRRGETLSLQEFAALSNEISKFK
jgi:16S rRNA (adenine1518-N6/adenine1519-N6)-dimethyltransferase